MHLILKNIYKLKTFYYYYTRKQINSLKEADKVERLNPYVGNIYFVFWPSCLCLMCLPMCAGVSTKQ